MSAFVVRHAVGRGAEKGGKYRVRRCGQVLGCCRVLMVDIGGGSVKLMLSGHRFVRAFETGSSLGPIAMMREARRLTADWDFEVVTIGYPGPVAVALPVGESPRVGTGWISFDFERAFGRHVRVINDAALQALPLVLGGGNAARLGRLPVRFRSQPNTSVLRGAERLWGRPGRRHGEATREYLGTRRREAASIRVEAGRYWMSEGMARGH